MGTEPGTTTAPAGMMRRRVCGGFEDGVVGEIVDRSAAGENDSSGEDGARADDCAFVDSGVAADESVVFDDDRRGVDGL